MDVSFFCRFSLPFQTQTKNAFPGTLAGKGVLCVTNTVKPNVKLGVFWLGLAWLGLQEMYHSFTPTIYLKYPKTKTFYRRGLWGFVGLLGSLCFLCYRVCCVNQTNPTNAKNSINLHPNVSVFPCFLCVLRVPGGKLLCNFISKNELACQALILFVKAIIQGDYNQLLFINFANYLLEPHPNYPVIHSGINIFA